MPLPSGMDAIIGNDFLNRNCATIKYDNSDRAKISFDPTDTVISAVFHTNSVPEYFVQALGANPETNVSTSSPSAAVSKPTPQPLPHSIHFLSPDTNIEVYDLAAFQTLVKQSPGSPVITLLVPHAPIAKSVVTSSHQQRIDTIHSEFEDVFTPPSGIPKREGGIIFDIPLKNKSTLPSPRHYDIPHHQQVILDEWLEKAKTRGWIAPCESPVNIPIFLVKKPGGWRTVLDFRSINAITESVHQSDIPRATRLLENLQKARILSKMDLHDGFYQLPLAEKSRHLTAFTVRGRQYWYLVSPQGLMNVPLYFQREVTRILKKHHVHENVRIQHLLPFISPTFRPKFSKLCPDTIVGTSNVYIDDILMGTETLKEVDHDAQVELHHSLVRAVLTAFRKEKLQVKLSKCDFFKKFVTFLGFVVGNGQLKTDSVKIEAINNWKAPTTVSSIRSFLGICNFFRRFIPGYSTITHPITNLLKKNVPFDWNKCCEDAFLLLKQKLTTAPVLVLPDFDKPFVIVTDASLLGIGVALLQEHDTHLHPVAYFSRTLCAAEKNYSAQHLEALAVVTGITHFRYYLYGAPFQVRVLTDHRSLQFLRTQRNLSGRLARWQELISEYDYTISYLPGRENFIADHLSRHAVSPSSAEILERLQTASATDLIDMNTTIASSKSIATPTISLLTRSQRRALFENSPGGIPQPFGGKADEENTSRDFSLFQKKKKIFNRKNKKRVSLAPALPPILETTQNSAIPTTTPEMSKPNSTHLTASISVEFSYKTDKHFGPIVQLFNILSSNSELLEMYTTSPSQLDLTKIDTNLHKFVPKLQYYQLKKNLLYNLHPTYGLTLCVPDMTLKSGINARLTILRLYHDEPLSGHRGATSTFLKLRCRYFWPFLREDVKQFVHTCEICNAAKSTTSKPVGLLQSPNLPTSPFYQISMDFVMNLPPDPIFGYDAILFVVCRFTKYAILIPTFTSVTGQGTVDLLYKHVFCKFGYPASIISDRDPRFTGVFCSQYMKLSGIKANMSSGGHAQTDGATERMIRIWEEMLRCYIDFDQHNLFSLIPTLEFALNDSPKPPTNLSAFQSLFGFSPLRPADIKTCGYQNTKVQSLQDHFETLASNQTHAIDALRDAQSKYVFEANKHRRAVPLSKFHVGDFVFVKRTNFIPPAMRDQPTRKLQPRYFGPYPIVRKITETAYKVRLPANVRTHPVFHSSQLKLSPDSEIFPNRKHTRLDPIVHNGDDKYWVDFLLRKRKFRNKIQYLVKWKSYPQSEATWEYAQSLKADGFQNEMDEFDLQ